MVQIDALFGQTGVPWRVVAIACRNRFFVVVHMKEVAVITAGLQVDGTLALVRSGLRTDHFFNVTPEEIQVMHRRIRFVDSTWARAPSKQSA
jgi:hypothetical protein